MKILPVICGPTASGKSQIAMELCLRMDGEIVSCDSMQIYANMKIGTAAPGNEDLRRARHHMVGIVKPDENYDAALFRDQAVIVIRDIISRGKIPILCGGTGLYIDALTRPMSMRALYDPDLRKELKMKAESAHGREELYEELRSIDPSAAQKIHKNDVKRVIRAIEVFRVSGMTREELREADKNVKRLFKGLLFAPNIPRSKLYERIDARVEKMISDGLVDEVKALLKRGISSECTSMQAIGYKETALYINGLITLDEAIQMIKRNTRRYAKRQMTWFGHDERVHWLDPGEYASQDIARMVDIIATAYKE